MKKQLFTTGEIQILLTFTALFIEKTTAGILRAIFQMP